MNAISVGSDRQRTRLRSVQWLAVALLAPLAIASLGSLSARAAEPPALQGDYVGGLSGRLLRLHLICRP
jgi:hypothetical protein